MRDGETEKVRQAEREEERGACVRVGKQKRMWWVGGMANHWYDWFRELFREKWKMSLERSARARS